MKLASKLWDAIDFDVAHPGELDGFVLTGSAVPADCEEITHFGTGDYVYCRYDGVYVVPIGCLKD